MDYLELAKQEENLLKELRHHIHNHPELSGQEKETIAYIDGKLTEFQIDHVVVEDGGVLGFIRGGKPGKTLLMRADCDALPIDEEPVCHGYQRPCVSENPGVMHACGHDLHTANLLVAGKILHEHRQELAGDILLFFERSEEKPGPYQKNLFRYIEEHKIAVDGSWGMHVRNGKGGVALFMPGPTGAGVFSFSFTIKGKGGHGSRPYVANNPIGCFQAIAAEMDRLRMNKLTPFSPVTLTICSVHAGNAGNVIPETLTFAGNARYFDMKEVGEPMREEIIRLVHQTAQIHGCEVIKEDVSEPMNPSIVDEKSFHLAEAMFKECFPAGSADTTRRQPSMGSETFANIMAKWPGIMFSFGIANAEKKIGGDIHQPDFDIDEDIMYLATAYAIGYADYFLKHA